MNDEQWKDDDSARARAAAALAIVDARQSKMPRCALCGQRVIKLDLYRLCSKVDGRHTAAREAAR